MNRHLSLVSLVVADYDDAIAFFTGALDLSSARIRRSAAASVGWSCAHRAAPAPACYWRGLMVRRQVAHIGDQTEGRVLLFLETDDFDRDHARMVAAGVRFVEEARHEAYGIVAVFEDLCGNRWDLIQRKSADLREPSP